MSLADLRAALTAELAATPEYYDFKVLRSEREGALWRVTLEPGYVFAEGQPPGQTAALGLLDESLEGASAWWGAPAKGHASVLALRVEEDQLVLQNASCAPPGPDQLIRLYPPRFLKALVEAAWDTPWAEAALALRPLLSRPAPAPAGPALNGTPFRWLRQAQRHALQALPGQRCAYLWGPPGTGKTTTLGVLLAEYLDSRPGARILLVSSTNQAVDQALVAVDKALLKGRREALRPSLQRLGTRFDPSAYEGREHLLPGTDPALLATLSRLESSRPHGGDALALKTWSDRLAALREQLHADTRRALRQARLAAMTASRATASLALLRSLDGGGRGETPFDLLVFDEASQLSLAQTLLLMPLGAAALFAGDPQQLAPVLRSREPAAKRWLGRSAFAEMPRQGPAVVLLDEQSRMAPPICTLVSEVFYEGALRVAADALQSPEWLARRQRPLADLAAADHVRLLPVKGPGRWSAQDRGPQRPASAEAVADAVAQALESGHWLPRDLVVLTPFRAQRTLLRRCLQARGIAEEAGVRVSTVHRAQGSEAPVVFFDPVDANLPFLQTEDARRLLNVALSRAQAKVLLYLSDADAASPLLAPLVQRLRLAGDSRTIIPLQALAAAPDFPRNALGQRVSAGRVTGEVQRLSPDGRQLWLVNERSGAALPLDADFWRARARSAL
ncbi:AAA family ATPase [Mitsuaria sp. WAJ17]|uniref:DEAD/DEAH box helicase n=1 Tax=Mitsuaria sp. WAJ17 TaxID=2761452 RepID=UPI0015FF1230|nr:AAA domain-containing protein [Mitsuaria sp. WAJ17]MBB2487544.1 AAA family ATPase [Mitsuaria sp. WAJ17]